MDKTTPLSGHLLIAIPFAEDKSVIARIRASHPDLRVTFLTSRLAVDWHISKGIPAETWQDVTHLCTLSEFPTDLSQAPKLQYVHVLSAGTDHLWQQPIWTSSDVPLTTSNGILATTIAEWVVLMSLSMSRQLDELRRRQAAQSWSETDGGDGSGKAIFQRGRDLAGQRCGILGYGSIGRAAARVLASMGMEIVVHTASPRPTPESRRLDSYTVPGTGDPEGLVPARWFSGTDRASLHRFLAHDLDQLLVCVPLTARTRHLLGRDELDLLARRNAVVMNVARGEIVDTDALVDALVAYEADADADADADDDKNDDGEADTVAAAEGGGTASKRTKKKRKRKGLRGAAVDVTDPEPLPKGHPLWTAPNCIITPHICGISSHYGERGLDLLRLNLDRIARGERPVSLVNRETTYASKE